jgi:hypothetical protein
MADIKKRRHHYVWRQYLNSWTEDEKIWCKRGDTVFSADLMNIGQQRDFYRLKELSDQDAAWIRRFVAKGGSEELRKTNLGWIDTFRMPFKVKNFVEKNNLSTPEIKKEIDIQINNTEENLHMRFEQEGGKYLSRLLDRDVSFFKNQLEALEFSHFLSLQYMRTKRMEREITAQFVDSKDVNMEAVWPVLRHVTSLNIATGILQDPKSYKLVLLEDASGVGFITGDQPVINTHSVGMDKLAPINDHEFYYPLSREIAVLLTNRDEYQGANTVRIDREKVEWFNRAIYDMSHEQIYGSSKAAVSCF